MKRIKSKYLSIALILLLGAEPLSFFRKGASTLYLAPISSFAGTEITLQMLAQQIPELAALLIQEQGGKSYEDFLAGITEFPKNSLPMLTINLSTQVIQKYFSLFLLSGQKWIPQEVDLNHIFLVGDEKDWLNEEWGKVFFPKNLKLKRVPEDLQKRSLDIVLFVLTLRSLALSQKMNPEFFLDNLLNKLEASEQVAWLFLLSYGLKKNLELLEQPFKACTGDLDAQALQFIARILDFQAGILQVFQNANPQLVAQNLEIFHRLIQAIPSGEIPVLDCKIGEILNEFVTGGKNKEIKKKAIRWYVDRFDFYNYLSQTSLENSYLETSL